MINRNDYLSLLESVQESVNPNEISEGIKWGDKTIGGARNARELAAWLNRQQNNAPSASSAGSVYGGGSTSVVSEGLRWGSKTIGGAKNARELAAWLNRQQNNAPSASAGGSVYGGGSTSVVSEGIKWGDKSIGGAKNARELAMWLNRQTGKKTTGRTATASTDGATSVVSEGLRWGSKTIGGARNARELAAWLNRQQNNAASVSGAGSVSGGGSTSVVSEADFAEALAILSEAKPSSSNPNRLSGRRLTHWLNSRMPSASSAGSVSGGSSGAGVVSEEEFDLIDEIIVEGLDLYGEEGLAEILADFAETGEMSEELALLLSDE